MQELTLALIQMQVRPDKAANLARAAELLSQAKQAKADLAVLPEMFTCPYALDQFHAYAEPLGDGPACRMLAEQARALGLHVVGGSFPEREGDKVYNTATLWGPDGALLLRHRKVHLFDVDIPGGISFQESAKLAPGNDLAVARTALGTIGLGVCYDLRFPELFRALALAGAELLVLPGAFNTTTGPAHWELLLRARAVENTCFVAACSPAPLGDGGYPAWGHSMAVDPYGAVLAQACRDEALITVQVGGARLEEVRRALPVLRQRRPEVYEKLRHS